MPGEGNITHPQHMIQFPTLECRILGRKTTGYLFCSHLSIGLRPEDRGCMKWTRQQNSTWLNAILIMPAKKLPANQYIESQYCIVYCVKQMHYSSLLTTYYTWQAVFLQSKYNSSYNSLTSFFFFNSCYHSITLLPEYHKFCSNFQNQES